MKIKVREEKIKLTNEQKTISNSNIVLRLTIKKDVIENRYMMR
jgi:hypothetical protein|tara:strand:- start:408 stop:536 length:129 start_codon:yes stop_codon:yes gene_type:complete